MDMDAQEDSERPIILKMNEPEPAVPYEAVLIPERLPQEPPGSYTSLITAELLDALERRYLPAHEQKCVVCGAVLTFSASGYGGSGARYNCPVASPVGSRMPLRERMEHWDRSTWYDRDTPNMGVVQLVRAYRELTALRQGEKE